MSEILRARVPNAFLKDIVAPACRNDEKIIDAFTKVPRALFVDEVFRTKAYTDNALPIGEKQTISQPTTVAHMLKEAELDSSHSVLEIGSGSGFLTALLSKLVCEVYAVERIPQLLKKSRDALRELSIKNAHTKLADGNIGWNEFAPFDRIIASAAGTKLPEKLLFQLAEGGIMIIPINNTLMKYRKINGEIIAEEGINVSFVDFVGG